MLCSCTEGLPCIASVKVKPAVHVQSMMMCPFVPSSRLSCTATPCALLHMPACTLMHPMCRQRLAGLQDADIDWFNPLEDGQALPTSATYDLMVTMDAIHDMAQPLEVVSAVRTASCRLRRICRDWRQVVVSTVSGICGVRTASSLCFLDYVVV
jgi:hypothetical protein